MPIKSTTTAEGGKNPKESTEQVKTNEEEIGKLSEKEFRIIIVKMIKTLNTKWRRCKNQLTKTLKNSGINTDKQHNY